MTVAPLLLPQNHDTVAEVEIVHAAAGQFAATRPRVRRRRDERKEPRVNRPLSNVFEDFRDLGGIQVEGVPQFPHLDFRQPAPVDDGGDLVEGAKRLLQFGLRVDQLDPGKSRSSHLRP